MKTLPDPKLINDICLISREGICLMDMKQVAEKARQIGLTRLAEIVEQDLKTNRIQNGQYVPALQMIIGI